MREVSAFTSGDNPTFTIERILTGRVVAYGPETKLLIITSSMDKVKDMNALDKIPGTNMGSVTRKKVTRRFAPRSIEAS